MNDLKVFSNTEFGELGVLMIDGKEWFPASQCAKILGYTNPQKAIRDHCKDPGVTKRSVGVTTGIKADGSPAMQTTQVKYINEGNLYRLIVSSKLPTAEKFERWVFDEVLPSIRKNGGYGNINIEQVIAQTATAVVTEVVKQLVPVLTDLMKNISPAKNAAMVTNKCAKNYVYQQPRKMDMLPPDVKSNADAMLCSGQYSCQQVANYITNATGQYISQVAVNKYKNTNFVINAEQLRNCHEITCNLFRGIIK